jgi:hypothetical protein
MQQREAAVVHDQRETMHPTLFIITRLRVDAIRIQLAIKQSAGEICSGQSILGGGGCCTDDHTIKG